MPRSIARLVDQVARQSIGKDWGLYAALLEHWTEIVGAEYARVTTPVKITFPHQPKEARRQGGTLSIRLPKGLALEFSYKAEQFRQRINAYFGYDAIARIAFAPTFGPPPEVKAPAQPPDPATLAALQKATDGIENNELREALHALGSAIATDRQALR